MAVISSRPTVEESYDVGREAYVYFYPLILMDLTRRISINVVPGVKPGMGPMNAFHHLRAYPPESFREVVRPNFDTLYSIAWLDLTKQPVIVTAPDTEGRYYLLPMLDMWTDVFASPGKRTVGTKAISLGVVPTGWTGRLPEGVNRIDAPTPYVWIIGRTQTNGVKDYAAVHKVQDGYTVTPLSQWGKPPIPVNAIIDPDFDIKTPPSVQVNTMPAGKYFSYAADLIKLNPPHVTDWSIIARLCRIGIEPGRSFEFDKAAPEIQEALNRAIADGLKRMQEKAATMARVVNNWQMNVDTMGVYGNFYLKRAIVAMVGLGANQPEDAIYPFCLGDADGKPLEGTSNYVLHFAKDELPPAEAFWSVTMYDSDGFPVESKLNRFAIGDRDPLKFNADRSLDIYIQHESPGVEKESNWLPSPAEGVLGVTMRLYAPKSQVATGEWVPPAVKRVSSAREASKAARV
jgi:hypothetical protein